MGAAFSGQFWGFVLIVDTGLLLAGGAAILVDHNADHIDARIGLELLQSDGHGGRFT